jgi:multicomponent Na+:H+ antiporter subunit G
MTILINVLALVGAAFILLAALGVLRFPDFYCRLHATAKAGAFGGTLLLLAAGFYFQNSRVWAQVVLTILFFYLTTPVASHLLGRAARRVKITMVGDDADV